VLRASCHAEDTEHARPRGLQRRCLQGQAAAHQPAPDHGPPPEPADRRGQEAWPQRIQPQLQPQGATQREHKVGLQGGMLLALARLPSSSWLPSPASSLQHCIGTPPPSAPAPVWALGSPARSAARPVSSPLPLRCLAQQPVTPHTTALAPHPTPLYCTGPQVSPRVPLL